jgi:hypothetical protein
MTIIQDAKRVLAQAKVSEKKAVEMSQLDKLQNELDHRDKIIADYEIIIADLTSLVEKWNLATSGQGKLPLVAQNDSSVIPVAEIIPKAGEKKATATHDVQSTIKFLKNTKTSDSKIQFAQYDDTFNLFVRVPSTKQLILLNGLPTARQRHFLSLKFAGAIASGDKGDFRKIHELSTDKPLTTTLKDGKIIGYYLTCGGIWRKNCKCEKRFSQEDVAPPEKEIADILANETQTTDTNVNQDALSELSQVLDVTEKPEGNKPTKKSLFYNVHNPKKGSILLWKMAQKSIAICQNKSIKHAGYLDMSYADICKLATDGGVKPEMLASDIS